MSANTDPEQNTRLIRDHFEDFVTARTSPPSTATWRPISSTTTAPPAKPRVQPTAP